jgi:hypothetical protein
MYILSLIIRDESHTESDVLEMSRRIIWHGSGIVKGYIILQPIA